MPTSKLFYQKPPLREYDARVLRAEADDRGRARVFLESTIFYPEGGGQPGDSGSIAGSRVVSLAEDGEEVCHTLEASVPEAAALGVVPGALVRCVVDLERRFDHSEQHTAQHLLSAVLLRLTGASTLSFHLGERASSIDLDVAPLSRAEADAVEDEVLRVIRDDYPVITHLCPPEDPSRFPLRKEPAVQAAVLRVVEIDGIEYSACCGTHVSRTRELGLFRIVKVEKYKGGCRVHYLAGGRAFADYRRAAGLARDASAIAGVPEDELPAAVAAYRDKAKALEKGLDEARGAAAASEAAFLRAAEPGLGVILAEAASLDAASRLARALAAGGRTGVVACRRELKAVACSPAAPDPGARAVDAAYGPLAARLGAKGGGGKAFFQAAFPDGAALDSFISAARDA